MNDLTVCSIVLLILAFYILTTRDFIITAVSRLNKGGKKNEKKKCNHNRTEKYDTGTNVAYK